MSNLTIIHITPEEALLFKEYQKNHELFNILHAQGVFNIQFGKATLNFAGGQLQNVIKEEVVWKK